MTKRGEYNKPIGKGGRCPECDSSQFYNVFTIRKDSQDKVVVGKYCRECGAEYDDLGNKLRPIK